MTEEIRRRRTADPEIDALVVLEQALASLDAETCERVLKWALDRFVETPKRQIKEMAWLSIQEQLEAYKKYAADLGVDERKFVHALSHVRSVKRMAPVDHDEDPAATEREAMEATRS